MTDETPICDPGAPGAGRASDPLPTGDDFRMLFAAAPLPMYVYDRETFAVLAANEAAVARTGRRREEILGQPATDVWPTDASPEAGIVASNLAFRGRPAVLIVRPGAMGRERGEGRHEEERFATVFRASPVAGVIRSLADGHFVDVNDRFLELTGYAREEVVGRTPSEVGLWAGSPAEDPLHVAGLVRERGRVRDHEGRLRTKAGEERRVLLSLERVELGGEPCLLGFGYDVTERRQAAEQRERLARLAALRADIAQALARGGATSGMLGACAAALAARLGAGAASVWLLDAAGEALELAAAAGVGPRGGAARVPVGRHRVGRVAATRRPYLAADLAADRLPEDKDWAGRAGLTAFAGHPLLVEGRLVGALAVFAAEPFGEDALEALASVADAIAQGVERKRAEDELRAQAERLRVLHGESARRARELALLDRVRTALAGELELSALLRAVVEAVAAALGYTQVALYLREGRDLVLQHQVGYGRVLARIPVAEGVMGRVVRTGEPALVADAAAEPAFLAAIEGGASEVCVPLREGEQVVGVLNVESTGGATLGEDDLRLAAAVGEYVDLALHRARLYEEARVSERRFRSLVANATDLVTVLDLDGTIRYESPAIERFLGHDPEALVGQDTFGFVHPDDRAGVQIAFAELVDNPEGRATVEFRFRHADGSWRWLEAVGTNLIADPAVGGVVVNSRDVTERRRLAAEAARVAALAESDKLKSALLGVVSHELKTPLAAVKATVGALRSPAAAWTLEDRDEALADVEAELDRLALLVGNLLDLTRIEGGALRPRLARHDPAELVAEAVARLAARAPDRPLAADIAPGLPPVRCDRILVAQVLDNLGDNAAKYAPPGTPVTIVARPVPGAVEFAVADAGPGIASEHLGRVFERFWRADRGGRTGGTGIGLTICKGLVEAHGGRIWAEGREGGGATVRFTLPLDPQEGGTA